MAPSGDGGVRLNFTCLGKGSPTVVFDAGWSDWAPAWAVVQPRIAAFTRACAYDRAGSGFSDPGPLPRTTERIATELHDAAPACRQDRRSIRPGRLGLWRRPRPRLRRPLPFRRRRPRARRCRRERRRSPPRTAKDDDDGDLGYVPKLRQCRDAIAAGNPAFALPARRRAGRRALCAQGFFRGLPEARMVSRTQRQAARPCPAQGGDVGTRPFQRWSRCRPTKRGCRSIAARSVARRCAS